MRFLARVAESACFNLGDWISRSPWYPHRLYYWLMVGSRKLDKRYGLGMWLTNADGAEEDT